MIEFTSSYEEITPTAIVGMPTWLRIASAYGVWYDRPKLGRSSGVICPVETSIAAAPASWNARAISTESGPVMPPSTQSVAEMRTVIGFVAGHTARIAANTSSGYRSRFSSDPPYSSVRWFVSGDTNDDSRYPWAQCS